MNTHLLAYSHSHSHTQTHTHSCQMPGCPGGEEVCECLSPSLVFFVFLPHEAGHACCLCVRSFESWISSLFEHLLSCSSYMRRLCGRRGHLPLRGSFRRPAAFCVRCSPNGIFQARFQERKQSLRFPVSLFKVAFVVFMLSELNQSPIGHA